MVCKNHIFFLSYVMIFIAFLVQVWRQRRRGRGGFLKYWFLLTGGGVQKGSKYTDVILEQPLSQTWDWSMVILSSKTPEGWRESSAGSQRGVRAWTLFLENCKLWSKIFQGLCKFQKCILQSLDQSPDVWTMRPLLRSKLGSTVSVSGIYWYTATLWWTTTNLYLYAV